MVPFLPLKHMLFSDYYYNVTEKTNTLKLNKGHLVKISLLPLSDLRSISLLLRVSHCYWFFCLECLFFVFTSTCMKMLEMKERKEL